jgi:hypothetical protein
MCVYQPTDWRLTVGRELEAMAAAFEALEPLSPEERHRALLWLDHKLEARTVDEKFGNLGGMADGDIMAIAFLVMREAAKEARADLKAIMHRMKSRRGVFVVINSGGSHEDDDE